MHGKKCIHMVRVLLQQRHDGVGVKASLALLKQHLNSLQAMHSFGLLDFQIICQMTLHIKFLYSCTTVISHSVKWAPCCPRTAAVVLASFAIWLTMTCRLNWHRACFDSWTPVKQFCWWFWCHSRLASAQTASEKRASHAIQMTCKLKTDVPTQNMQSRMAICNSYLPSFIRQTAHKHVMPQVGNIIRCRIDVSEQLLAITSHVNQPTNNPKTR